MIATKERKEKERKQAYMKTQGSTLTKSYNSGEESKAPNFATLNPFYSEVRQCSKNMWREVDGWYYIYLFELWSNGGMWRDSIMACFPLTPADVSWAVTVTRCNFGNSLKLQTCNGLKGVWEEGYIMRCPTSSVVRKLRVSCVSSLKGLKFDWATASQDNSTSIFHMVWAPNMSLGFLARSGFIFLVTWWEDHIRLYLCGHFRNIFVENFPRMVTLNFNHALTLVISQERS